MSTSLKPRVVRKNKPERTYKKRAARQALSLLLEDFSQRCAYSMLHVKTMGGETLMEVDHFDPSQKRECGYDNLFPVWKLCNLKKKDRPWKNDSALGMRFLNPCLERDYDELIFEDPATNLLVGATEIAEWHITILDLNCEFLVRERARRAKLAAAVDSPVVAKFTDATSSSMAMGIAHLLLQIAEEQIPIISAPPAGLAPILTPGA